MKISKEEPYKRRGRERERDSAQNAAERKNSCEADQKERSVCNLSGNTDTAAYVDDHHQLALHLPITTRQSHLFSLTLTFFLYLTILNYTALLYYLILRLRDFSLHTIPAGLQLIPSYQSPRLVRPQPSWLTRQNNLCWAEVMLTNPHRPGRPHRLVLNKLHRLSCLPNRLRFWSIGKMMVCWHTGQTRHDVVHQHLDPFFWIESPESLGCGYNGQWCLSWSC